MRVLPLLLVLACTTRAEAHAGRSYTGADWWRAWHADPLVLLNLGLLATLYAAGIRRLWQHGGRRRSVRRWQVVSFALALAALLLALLSPLDTLADDLSWVHMTQHMVLMMVAAPLFVLGSPGLVMLWAVPRAWRGSVAGWMWQSVVGRTAWRLAWNPILVWSLHAVVLWGWHLPALYEAALGNRWIHDVEHFSFFAVAYLFWRVAIDPLSRFRLDRGAAVLYLFTTSLHATVLGVFMTLAEQPWYAAYEGRTELWNLTALEDQQLAGLIMWMPACMIYAIVAAAIFGLWIQQLETVSPRAGAGRPARAARRPMALLQER